MYGGVVVKPCRTPDSLRCKRCGKLVTQDKIPMEEPLCVVDIIRTLIIIIHQRKVWTASAAGSGLDGVVGYGRA